MALFRILIFTFLIMFALVGLGQEVTLNSSELPIIIIDTSSPITDTRIRGSMKIIHNGAGFTNNVSDSPNEYNGAVSIEYRSQPDSWANGKYSYSLELKDSNDEDQSVNIFDMGAEEDWVLHGPYSDKTLIRNYLSMYLWNQMDRYGPAVQLCEVVINDNYKGVYVFMENIKRDETRIDISKLNPDENSGDDLTGGYIFKIDKVKDDPEVKSWISNYPPESDFLTDQVINFELEYPKPEDVTTTQFNYIKSYINSFEAALHGDQFLSAENGYSQYIDVGSFVDFSLLTELTKNEEAYRRDCFFYKDKDSKDSKIKAGPPWDFQFTLGNNDNCESQTTTGWIWDFNEVCGDNNRLNPFWWKRLMDSQGYLYTLKNRWIELRSGPYSTTKLMALIDSLATTLEEPQQRNFQRWPVLSQSIAPNSYVGNSYENEISYLKSWVTQRVDWIDNQFDAMEIILHNESMDDLKINVFPNPVQTSLNISSKVELNSFYLINQTGKTIKSSLINAKQTSIDMATITKGVYILNLKLVDGSTSSKLIMK